MWNATESKVFVARNLRSAGRVPLVCRIYIFSSFFSLNSVWMPWSPDAVWTTSRRWWWLRPSLSRSRRMSSTCSGRVGMQQICKKNVFKLWNRRRENNPLRKSPIFTAFWPGPPCWQWFLNERVPYLSPGQDRHYLPLFFACFSWKLGSSINLRNAGNGIDAFGVKCSAENSLCKNDRCHVSMGVDSWNSSDCCCCCC